MAWKEDLWEIVQYGKRIFIVGRTTVWIGDPGLFEIEGELSPTMHAFMALVVDVMCLAASGSSFLDFPTLMD